MRATRWSVRGWPWAIAGAVFFLNPFLACGGDPDFQYGPTEMRAAVEGTWDLDLLFSNGEQRAVTITIRQSETAMQAAAATNTPGQGRRAWIRPAAACGTRTLVRGAAACLDVSQMPLDVAFVSGDESYRSISMRGDFSIYSLVFTQGQLALLIGNTRIDGVVSPDGEASGLRILDSSGGGTATLARTAR